MQRFFSLGFLSVLAALGDLDGGFFFWKAEGVSEE